MTKQIKIFNSEKEAGNLEGTCVSTEIIKTRLDSFSNWLFHACRGKFTPTQRLKYETKNNAKELNADYAVITDEYFALSNMSNDKLCIKVNFYKQK